MACFVTQRRWVFITLFLVKPREEPKSCAISALAVFQTELSVISCVPDGRCHFPPPTHIQTTADEEEAAMGMLMYRERGEFAVGSRFWQGMPSLPGVVDRLFH
jgi:hypothetical protein